MDFNNEVKAVSDYCNGELLYDYINRDDINKTQILCLIKDVAWILDKYREAFEKCPYGGVNPYNVLITKEGEVLLLDMNERSNDFVELKMQCNTMKDNFYTAYNKICVESEIDVDIFTYAVTVGYIMATVSKKVKFTKYEQKRIMKIVSRCIGIKRTVYTDFKGIKIDLKKYIDEDYKRVQKKTTAAITILVLLLVILSFVSVSF